MKQCPNSTCPHKLKHGKAAEYLDSADVCHDCKTPLVNGHAVNTSTDAPSKISKTLWRRIGVTLTVPLAIQLISKIQMPGIVPSEIMTDIIGDALSILSLGITPLLTAFFFVEIAAALVPKWRRLRTGGPIGRGRLRRATIWAALVLSFLQSFGVVAYLRSLADVDGDLILTMPTIVPMLSLVAGTGIIIALTRIVDRYGLGNGLCVIMLYHFGMQIFYTIGCFTANRALLPGSRESDHSLTAAVLIVALIAATRHILKTDWKNQTIPKNADIITGLFFVTLVLNWGIATDALNQLFSDWSWWFHLAILCGATFVSGFLFKKLAGHPVHIVSVVENCGEDPSAVLKSGPAAGKAIRSAWMRSAAFLALLVATWYWTTREGGCLKRLVASDFCFYLIVSTAVVLDIIDDFKNHLSKDGLQSVWPIERLYTLGPVLRMLERNGITAYPKNVHAKSLLQFAGPYVPFELMVESEQRKSAQKLLYEALIRKETAMTETPIESLPLSQKK